MEISPVRSQPSFCRADSSVSSSSSQGRTKRQLQRYSLDDLELVEADLGSGSYGSVDKVRQKSTGNLFALKKIPKKRIMEHEMASYLLREVKTQMKMNHPNILQLHYYFEDEHNVLLLLEFAPHGSLFSLLRRQRRLEEREAAPILRGLAAALAHLHARNIVHRDVKPENVLLCEGHIAKLADFGWCAELSGNSRTTFCGTWDYLSPEMIANEAHSIGVDIWALGVLLYELLVGSAPFQASNQAKIMKRIVNVDLVLPEAISDEAKSLIKSLLVRQPDQRLSLADAQEHPWVRRWTSISSERSGERLSGHSTPPKGLSQASFSTASTAVSATVSG